MARISCIIAGMTAAADRSASLRSLLSHQAGLATRAQLRQVGVAAHVVAVLDGGGDCVLDGFSALHEQ